MNNQLKDLKVTSHCLNTFCWDFAWTTRSISFLKKLIGKFLLWNEAFRSIFPLQILGSLSCYHELWLNVSRTFDTKQICVCFQLFQRFDNSFNDLPNAKRAKCSLVVSWTNGSSALIRIKSTLPCFFWKLIFRGIARARLWPHEQLCRRHVQQIWRVFCQRQRSLRFRTFSTSGGGRI